MEKKDNKLEKLNINSSVYLTRLNPAFKNKELYKPADKSKLYSFIPGTVVELLVKEGQKIKKGDELLVLEAMKMKNRLKSPVSGTVSRISVEIGKKVPKGSLLMEFKPD